MTIIEQIKAEIEGWLREYAEDSQFELGERYGYKRLLSLLSTLESEKPINQSTRQRFAEWSKTPEGMESHEKVAEEMRKQISEDKELEKEISKSIEHLEGCTTKINGNPEYHLINDEDLREFARHFAQWGAEHAREQMMKDAVEMYPCYDEEHNLVGFSTDYEANGAYGQLTRIIIVKESEK